MMVAAGGMRGLSGLIAACLALLALAACQTDEALTLEDAAPTRDVEVYGDGATVIALLAARSATGVRGEIAQARVDGARLALEQLGGGALTLRVYDTGTTEVGASSAAAAARIDGAVLLAGTSTVRQAAAAANASQLPLIAFTSGAIGAESGVFSFLSDTVDSLLEGVRLTVSAEQKQIVIIHGSDRSTADLARLSAGIAARGGSLVGAIPYPDRSAAIARALAAEKDKIDTADVALIFGDADDAMAVLDALNSETVGGGLAAVIGQSDWPNTLLGTPSARDVLIARIPDPQIALINDRFQDRFGRAPKAAAAEGFDVVAVAAGLARSGALIDRQALTAEKGFRALTGLFRFRADGSVERRHLLYQVQEGRLELVQEAGAGF